jgi:hypothetical protein
MEDPNVTTVGTTTTSGPTLKGLLDLEHIIDTSKVSQRWIAGESTDIAEGGRLFVEAGETSIGIFRVEGQLDVLVELAPLGL